MPAMAELPEQRNGLQPTEAFLNPLALLLTDLVTRVASGARADGAPAWSLRVPRYVRCYLHLAALGYKLFRVVTLVGSHRDPLFSRDCSIMSNAASRSAVPLACRTAMLCSL